jgi:proline dehydrogenase
MEMTGSEDRWALPDLAGALRWCRERNARGIRCTLDVLGENAMGEEVAAGSVEAYLSSLRAIEEEGLSATISVKLTDLGALFDRGICRENLRILSREAAQAGVGFEIDIEGKPLAEFTLEAALECAVEGPLTLAVAANFDRTAGDLLAILRSGIRPRLVKGAYPGDVADFREVQGRLKGLVEVGLAFERPFSLATHDPEVIEWALKSIPEEKGLVEFGFLMGLSDGTKERLAGQGWAVSEYVPFGSRRRAYEARRLQYLRELARLGREPAP